MEEMTIFKASIKEYMFSAHRAMASHRPPQTSLTQTFIVLHFSTKTKTKKKTFSEYSRILTLIFSFHPAPTPRISFATYTLMVEMSYNGLLMGLNS